MFPSCLEEFKIFFFLKEPMATHSPFKRKIINNKKIKKCEKINLTPPSPPPSNKNGMFTF